MRPFLQTARAVVVLTIAFFCIVGVSWLAG